MSARAIKDEVAIVGVGSTGFMRDSHGRSAAALAQEASVAAIRDAGLGAADIDGVVSAMFPGAPPAKDMVAALGLPRVTHYVEGYAVIVAPLIDAMNAIYAGVCDTVLVYHAVYRTPLMSRSAARDPFRRSVPFPSHPPESLRDAVAYAAWAARYLHDYPVRREHFGYVAINGRTNAGANPLAGIREPLTMDDYLSARMVRDPLCVLDMDFPVDGADAFVLTTRERARDMPHDPVLVHAAITGMVGANDEDQLPSLDWHGQDVAAAELWARSDLSREDVQLLYTYDGFSMITLSWLEKLGFCGPGEAGEFVEHHWDAEQQRILINGAMPVNSHGGSLSEGATQGSGCVREAVLQLRGQAGERQVEGAQAALLGIGGFFFNSQAMILRTRDR